MPHQQGPELLQLGLKDRSSENKAQSSDQENANHGSTASASDNDSDSSTSMDEFKRDVFNNARVAITTADVEDLQDFLLQECSSQDYWFSERILDYLGSRQVYSPENPERRLEGRSTKTTCPLCLSTARTGFRLRTVEGSADRGCITCAVIRDALIALVPDPYKRYFSVDADSVLRCVRHRVGYNRANADLDFDIELYVPEDEFNPNPEYFPHLARSQLFLPSRTDSNESIERARSWLKECLENHPACGSNVEKPLPSWIIDVGLDDAQRRVRLRESSGLVGQYVALSHCWGHSKPQCITTTETLERNKEEIPWDSLSKTFQDAVQLVRQLGKRYLWIDSICIIQNDLKHWEVESARMIHVYQNAIFTIAATKSANSDGGLFSILPSSSLPAPCSGQAPDGTPYTVYARRCTTHFDWLTQNDNRPEYPLLQRAWVYQERLLSPRILHFCATELIWECITTHECQCSPFTLSSYKAEYAAALSDGAASPAALRTLWYKTVNAYGRLALSHSTDVFPALSGVAKMYACSAARPEGERSYLAGLWRDTLITDLTWTVVPTAVQRRPRPLRAPTWSWACVPRSWRYPNVETLADATFLPCAVVRSAEVVLASDDPTGKVTGGRLVLEGQLQALAFTTFVNEKGDVFHFCSAEERVDAEFLQAFWDCVLDEEGSEDHVPNGGTVWALRLGAWRNRDDKEVAVAVVLRRVEGEVYEKIGSFSDMKQDVAEKLFEGLERVAVTIV